MEQLKVIGALLASVMVAGTLWWLSNKSPPRHPKESEKGEGSKRSVKCPEVPASIKLRHERILRAKPKKRAEESQPTNVCAREVHYLQTPGKLFRGRRCGVHSRPQKLFEAN